MTERNVPLGTIPFESWTMKIRASGAVYAVERRIGELVRWWPTPSDEYRYSDGVVVGPTSMRITSHGPRWSSTDGLIGDEVTKPRGRIDLIVRAEA